MMRKEILKNFSSIQTTPTSNLIFLTKIFDNSILEGKVYERNYKKLHTGRQKEIFFFVL